MSYEYDFEESGMIHEITKLEDEIKFLNDLYDEIKFLNDFYDEIKFLNDLYDNTNNINHYYLGRINSRLSKELEHIKKCLNSYRRQKVNNQ